MKITFQYNKEKDIWCLLRKGKNSYSAQSLTKARQGLISKYGETPTIAQASHFIDEYIAEKNISIERYIQKYQEEWDTIADEYQKRAEAIFGISLPEDIVAYFTIDSLCPYSIPGNYFFVTTAFSVSDTGMHELWHFYTWYAFGEDQEEKLGKEKYNDLKEALTVLLNVECKDLFPEDVVDTGYSQHKELREKILEFWEKDKDINSLWGYLTKL